MNSNGIPIPLDSTLGTCGEICVQAGGRTRARFYGLVRKGLIGYMSPGSEAQPMGIRLIPPRYLTDLSPAIYCKMFFRYCHRRCIQNTTASPNMSFSYGLNKRDTAGLRCVDQLGALVPCYGHGTHATHTFVLFHMSTRAYKGGREYEPPFPIFPLCRIFIFIPLYFTDLWYMPPPDFARSLVSDI